MVSSQSSTQIPHLVIVDDDDVSNYLTKLWLASKQLCGDIDFAVNGQEAKVLFEQFQDEKVFPDLMLLDINMPLMNGFDFLDWYEKSGYTGRTKIAMYTTSVRTQDRKKAAGYKDVIEFLEKPLTDESMNMVRQKLAEVGA